MVERIQSGSSAEVALLVFDTPDSPARYAPPGGLEGRAHRLFRRIRRSIEPPPRRPDAFAAADLAPLVAGVERLEVVPERGEVSDRFRDADVAAIRARDLDVLVRVGFRTLAGDILRAARHGVWSYQHGDNRRLRGGPPGFWESMEGWPETGITLQRLTESIDHGPVLARATSSTNATSVEDNNNANYLKSAMLLPRELEALHRKGPERYFADALAREPHPVFYSNRFFGVPSKRASLGLLARRLAQRIRGTLVERLTRDQWILLARFDDGFAGEFWRYRRIEPPRDRFWADPFPIERGGRYYVFFEELPFATGKGYISAMELLPDGSHGTPVRVLEEKHHLSYPFLLETGGELYMIPESKGGRCIPLYRCVEFPARWEKVMDLMDEVSAVDATVHFHEGRWWLMASVVEVEGAPASDELFVFHAERFPTREWTPHPMNPVVSDARRARPGGALFVHEGRLYRPSQDCGPRYGWGINLNLVERLTPEEYAERPVTRGEPGWAGDVACVHTFNRAGRLHVIDALVRRSRF